VEQLENLEEATRKAALGIPYLPVEKSVQLLQAQLEDEMTRHRDAVSAILVALQYSQGLLPEEKREAMRAKKFEKIVL
jgi:hypothetical protein